MRQHRAQHRKPPRSRQEGRPPLDATDLFRKHQELLPARHGIGKTVDVFTSLCSKSTPCVDCAAALQDLLDIVLQCPVLISPFLIVIDRAVQELSCKNSVAEADVNGLFQAIKFTQFQLTPALEKLGSRPSITTAAEYGASSSDMKRWVKTLRRRCSKTLTQLRSLLQASDRDRLLHGTARQRRPSCSPSPHSQKSLSREDIDSIDVHLFRIADVDMDESSVSLRAAHVEKIRETLEKRITPVFNEPVSVSLFGSTLTGLTHLRSDIDMTAITRSPRDRLKDKRQQIVSDLKNMEVSLSAVCEIERLAFFVSGCISQYKVVSGFADGAGGSAPERIEGDEEGSAVDAIGMDSITLDLLAAPAPTDSKQTDLWQYTVTTLLNKAILAFKDLRASFESLRAWAALDQRSRLRQQLTAVESDIYDSKRRLLLNLARVLRNSGCTGVVPVAEARIGVIKFVDRSRVVESLSWQCDLVVNQRLGIENSRLILAYTTFDKSGKIKRFLLLLKQFVKSFRLNLAPNGLLSSFAWIVLGLHYLLRSKLLPNFQQTVSGADGPLCDGINVGFEVPEETPIFTSKLASTPLADMLLGFFVYMSDDVCISSEVLTMRGAGETILKTSWSRCPAWRISIEDPLERTDSLLPHDLGSTVNVAGQKKILESIFQAKELLKSAYESGEKSAVLHAWDSALREVVRKQENFQALGTRQLVSQNVDKGDSVLAKDRHHQTSKNGKGGNAAGPSESIDTTGAPIAMSAGATGSTSTATAAARRPRRREDRKKRSSIKGAPSAEVTSSTC